MTALRTTATPGPPMTLDEVAELLDWGPDEVAAEIERRRSSAVELRRSLGLPTSNLDAKWR